MASACRSSSIRLGSERFVLAALRLVDQLQDIDGVLRVGAGACQLVGTAAGARQVAERFELVHDALVHHRGFDLLVTASAGETHVLQLRFEFLDLGTMLLDDVVWSRRGRRSDRRVRAAGARMYFQRSVRMALQFSPIHVHLRVERLGVGDVRRRRLSAENAGTRLRPWTYPGARPPMTSSSVGRKSMVRACCFTRSPAGMPGPAMMNGMRSVES